MKDIDVLENEMRRDIINRFMKMIQSKKYELVTITIMKGKRHKKRKQLTYGIEVTFNTDKEIKTDGE